MWSSVGEPADADDDDDGADTLLSASCETGVAGAAAELAAGCPSTHDGGWEGRVSRCGTGTGAGAGDCPVHSKTTGGPSTVAPAGSCSWLLQLPEPELGLGLGLGLGSGAGSRAVPDIRGQAGPLRRVKLYVYVWRCIHMLHACVYVWTSAAREAAAAAAAAEAEHALHEERSLGGREGGRDGWEGAFISPGRKGRREGRVGGSFHLTEWRCICESLLRSRMRIIHDSAELRSENWQSVAVRKAVPITVYVYVMYM